MPSASITCHVVTTLCAVVALISARQVEPPKLQSQRYEILGAETLHGNAVVHCLSERGEIVRFSGGVASTRVAGHERLSLINLRGQQITEQVFLEVRQCSHGLIPVKAKGKWQYITIEGEVAFDGEWDDARPFTNGRAAIAVDGKWGFIDATGHAVVPPTYREVRDFHEGRAAVFDGEEWQFVNPAGNPVTRGRYKAALDYSEGFAAVNGGFGWMLVDIHGMAIDAETYDELTTVVEGHAIARLDGAYFLIDTTGSRWELPKLGTPTAASWGVVRFVRHLPDGPKHEELSIREVRTNRQAEH